MNQKFNEAGKLPDNEHGRLRLRKTENHGELQQSLDLNDTAELALRKGRREISARQVEVVIPTQRDRKQHLNVKSGGTPNITGWSQGDRLTSLSDVKVGDVLLNISDQFDAQNLVRITRTGNDIVSRDEIAYGVFCDPVDVANTRARGDLEFSIWSFELQGTRQAYYRAIRC
ncbi:hypothetical protein [Paraburkholderia sp. SIMBA_054]|uniref:hypothetical protein n=1 Tax=Paraburkholderia sp. SIMBA_054 TaxID=3085795 RepID=UPI0039790263